MRYEVHVPSTHVGKVTSAETATKNYHLRNFGDQPIEVVIDSRAFPSGRGSPRPEIPFSVGSLKSTLLAANVRVEQVETALNDEANSDADVELIIAQENGLRLGWGRNKKGRVSFGIYDHTVALVKDMASSNTFIGVSTGVRCLTRDFVSAALKKGGLRKNTATDILSQRMLKRGVIVDKQNPHLALGYPSRDVFILEATENALMQVPLPRRI
jgi:hypothetical protein